MKKRKAMGFVLILFFLWSFVGCAVHHLPLYLPNEDAKLISFKPDSEPGGFGDIRWETDFSTLSGMKHYRTDPSYGGIEFYFKEREKLKTEKGKYKTIQYGFWKGKFYVGMITTRGISNWNALKEDVFGKFGEGAKPFINKEEYLWVGEKVMMALQYDEISKAGVYYLRSDVLRKKMSSQK